jgi:hypothetical protein
MPAVVSLRVDAYEELRHADKTFLIAVETQLNYPEIRSDDDDRFQSLSVEIEGVLASC